MHVPVLWCRHHQNPSRLEHSVAFLNRDSGFHEMLQHFREDGKTRNPVADRQMVSIRNEVHLRSGVPIQFEHESAPVRKEPSIPSFPSTDIQSWSERDSKYSRARQHFGKLTAWIIASVPAETVLIAFEKAVRG